MTFLHKLSNRLARLKAPLILSLAAGLSCERPIGTTDPTTTAVTRIAVSPKDVTLFPNQTTDITAVGFTAAGDTAMGISVSWSVTGGTIIDTSTSSGRHYGRYKSGTQVGRYKVVASSSAGTSDSGVVTVAQVPVATVAVTPAATSATVGQMVQLTATPQDSTGAPLAGRVVTWSTSNAGVATVNGSGLVTGVVAGPATITATSEGKSVASAITVASVPVASVTVSPASANVTAGQPVQLTATPRDVNGAPLTGRVVSWATSNAAVATVNGSGLVTGAAAGSTTITATSEGHSGTSAITVASVPVASVTVSPASASVSTGQTVQLTATPRDANGAPLSGRVVTWSSNNAAVATVNGSGLVTGVATGSATITATSEGQNGTSAISVSVPVASVTVSPATASILGGQTVQLTATPKDANGNVLNGRTVTWTSSNGGVATVNGTGLVTAVAAGTAIITAACESATGTAAITATNVPVASVTVSPATASIQVGHTVQLTATPKDANGNPLSGRTITWATSSALVATVSGTGLAGGVALGSATITATSEGQSGTSSVAVVQPPPPGSLYPNQPAGFVQLVDQAWNAVPPYPATAGSAWWEGEYVANASIVTDATAPQSPSNVLSCRVPAGTSGGVATCVINRSDFAQGGGAY